MASKGNHRAPWHDYRAKAKYLITLKKAPSAPIFGEIAGKGNYYTLLSKTGTIVKNSIAGLRSICDDIKLWQYIVMPDHIHLLLNVENQLEEPLGNHIARLKVAINHQCGEKIFDSGFNDQIITPLRSLDVIFQYIKNNPRRLAVRYEHPEYFRKINNFVIAGRNCQAYGNINLLHNPFKETVVCHRSDSELVRAANLEKWRYTGANGGVLVSPFISSAEKMIRKETEELGGKIILISNKLFNDREKPTGHNFELCEQGRLLIITPLDIRETLDRATCLDMNSFAEKICESTFSY